MNNEDIKIVKTNDNEFRYEGVPETFEIPNESEPDPSYIPPYEFTDEEVEAYEKFCEDCNDGLPFSISELSPVEIARQTDRMVIVWAPKYPELHQKIVMCEGLQGDDHKVWIRLEWEPYDLNLFLTKEIRVWAVDDGTLDSSDY